VEFFAVQTVEDVIHLAPFSKRLFHDYESIDILKQSMPAPIIAISCCAICCALDSWATGRQSDCSFSFENYGTLYSTLIALIVRLTDEVSEQGDAFRLLIQNIAKRAD
jgi:hypothetical protein